MRRMIFFATACLCVLSSWTFAEEIYLKNGNKVTGEVIEKTDSQIKINVRGVTLTYFTDEVERVGSSAVASTQAPEETSSSASPEVQKVTAQPSKSTDVTRDSSLGSLDKENLIVKLIEVSGAKENMRLMFEQMLKESPPDESATLARILNLDEIVSTLIPVYGKYFLVDELKELISFYQSPIGRKLLKVTPNIIEDSMQASMIYFQKKIESAGGSISGSDPFPDPSEGQPLGSP